MNALKPPPTDEAELRRIAEKVALASGAVLVLVFGSVARGESGPESDLDLLLVLEDDANLLEAASHAQWVLSPRRFAVDLVSIQESSFHNLRNVLMMNARPDMKVLYG